VAGLAALCARRPELRDRLRVCQIGPRESVNDALVAAAGLSDLFEFRPPRRHAEILQTMAAADALLLLEADEPQGSLITPGKIFEYLMVGRPILALVPEGPAADLVRRFAAGTVVAPGDASGIADLLAAWLSVRPAPPIVPAGELAQYARPALARRLAELLEGIVLNAPAAADHRPSVSERRRGPMGAPHPGAG
jgi:glycosyltransferase involved in cell wall biosynthesis